MWAKRPRTERAPPPLTPGFEPYARDFSAQRRTAVNFGSVVTQNCYAIGLSCSFYEGSGGGEIRTHEAFRPSGFQDRRDQPLCHPSPGSVVGD